MGLCNCFLSGFVGPLLAKVTVSAVLYLIHATYIFISSAGQECDNGFKGVPILTVLVGDSVTVCGCVVRARFKAVAMAINTTVERRLNSVHASSLISCVLYVYVCVSQ